MVSRSRSSALRGAGKTTIADLLLGLLQLSSGLITVEDGSEASARRQASRMGYVPQPSYLLYDSVRKNVAFGTNDADIDDARLSQNLKSVYMADVVAQMDGQLDSRVGRDGARMSGGQRQRLGIARALYEDPDTLVLDEATSALDNETEREVSAAIMSLARDRTLLIIAHRLNTVKRCDKILLFECGRLVAEGDYDSLTRKSERFRRLIEAGEI